MKQMGLAFQQYTQDYDGYMVRSEPGSLGEGPYFWPRNVQPYVKNTQIFTCPSEKAPRTFENIKTSYVIQTAAYSYPSNFALGWKGNEAVVEWPSEFAVMGDLRGTVDDVPPAYYPGSPHTTPAQEDEPLTTDDINPATGSSYRFAYRHFEGSNFMFADGHAKWAKKGSLNARNLTRNSSALAAYTANKNDLSGLWK